jgi:putative Holliday junction resolvase
MRLGRRIAIDYGSSRIGVAVSSVDSLISSPLATVHASEMAVSEVAKLINEQEPIEVLIGLPLNLQGNHTKSTDDAIQFAIELQPFINPEIRMVDERLSTRAAQSQMLASGKNTKNSRSQIDAAAASLILEGALAFEKSTGKLPGKPLSEFHA